MYIHIQKLATSTVYSYIVIHAIPYLLKSDTHLI